MLHQPCENCGRSCDFTQLNNIVIEDIDGKKIEYKWCGVCFRVFNIGVGIGQDQERYAVLKLMSDRRNAQGNYFRNFL